MYIKFTYLLIFGLLFMSSINSEKNADTPDYFKLETSETEFEAGTTIVLKFFGKSNLLPKLYLSHSYGSTIIKSNLIKGVFNFRIPEAISKKTGMVTWKLLHDNTPLIGHININPKQQVSSIETYIGPPSIAAGGTDFSMVVIIPTDIYDNPLPDNTAVNVKKLFLSEVYEEVNFTKNRISYKNIYSPMQTGRILVSSESLGANSKEYDVNVLPANPTDFTISYQRHHMYADGNQITTFSTSAIKDDYGNIVSDGTYVEYYIRNDSNVILKTSGTTIDGVATSKMIHPNQKENWKVKAFIEGMAESNIIEFSYEPVISDFDISFSEDKRTITIGPLKSFMGQMIPDGLEVKITICKNDDKISVLIKSSFEGYATFKLNTNNYPDGTFTLKIEVAGIEKTFSNLELW